VNSFGPSLKSKSDLGFICFRDTGYTGVMLWPPRFIFIAARLSLDFAQTGGEGERARWERWHSPEDLSEWMTACPHLKVRASVTKADLIEARVLREAILRGAEASLRGENVPSDVIEVLHRNADRPNLVPHLEAGSAVWVEGSSGQQVLSSVARDAIDLFGSEARLRLRKCQNPSCDLMFVDTSRPGKRVWCSMERCGNLNKIARYRTDARKLGKKVSRTARPGKEQT
jgi:predicted RNA-binding Zn ribbon-like protein